jgi:hypothetical protein
MFGHQLGVKLPLAIYVCTKYVYNKKYIINNVLIVQNRMHNNFYCAVD